MKVLFNPRCTKCHNLRKELDANDVDWERILYLEGVLDRTLVEQIFERYAGNWHNLIRIKEKTFKASGIKLKDISKVVAIEMVLKNPVLMQRPIVIKDDRAYIARDDVTVVKMVGTNYTL